MKKEDAPTGRAAAIAGKPSKLFDKATKRKRVKEAIKLSMAIERAPVERNKTVIQFFTDVQNLLKIVESSKHMKSMKDKTLTAMIKDVITDIDKIILTTKKLSVIEAMAVSTSNVKTSKDMEKVLNSIVRSFNTKITNKVMDFDDKYRDYYAKNKSLSKAFKSVKAKIEKIILRSELTHG